MSILIKGMEMPTSCPCELLGTGYDLYCSFALGIPARVKEYYECCQNNKRPSWCPLVSVPPHGRLVDADWIREALIHTLEALKKNPKMDRQEMHLIAAFSTLGRMLEDAPTIIEAEEGEKA